MLKIVCTELSLPGKRSASPTILNPSLLGGFVHNSHSLNLIQKLRSRQLRHTNQRAWRSMVTDEFQIQLGPAPFTRVIVDDILCDLDDIAGRGTRSF